MVTVITRTTFPEAMWSTMEELTEKSIPVFEKQKGFIGMEVHKALDNSGTLSIFKWDSIQDHEDCMNSRDWEELNPEWEKFMQSEGVRFEFLFNGSPWK